MTSIKELLDIRKQMKSKKPDFIRQDIRKKARLKIKWRKPRGLDSKMRRKLRGWAKGVSQGYRSPGKVRGMHQSGLRPSVIRTAKDLDNLSPEENCLVVSSSFGKRKRVEVLKKAREKNFQVVNIKSPEDYIKKVEEAIISRKTAKQEKGREQKTEKSTKKAGGESIKEDKKEMEKKEKDRLLTKKEI